MRDESLKARARRMLAVILGTAAAGFLVPGINYAWEAMVEPAAILGAVFDFGVGAALLFGMAAAWPPEVPDEQRH